MVIGLDRARQFLDDRPELEALLVYEQDGKMENYWKMQNNE